MPPDVRRPFATTSGTFKRVEGEEGGDSVSFGTRAQRPIIAVMFVSAVVFIGIINYCALADLPTARASLIAFRMIS